MPFIQAPPPESSKSKFKAWLIQYEPNDVVTQAEDTWPHQVFHVNPDDIIKGKGLVNAHIVAWRFIYSEPSGRNLAIEIQEGTDTDGDGDQFSEVNFGPMVDEVKSFLQVLATSEVVEKGNFTICFLRMTPLLIKVIWLKSDQPEKDYFMALSPSFFGLEAGRLYTAETFLPMATEAAKQFFALVKSMSQSRLVGG